VSVRDIATIGEPVLRAPTRELSAEELSSPRWQTFIDDLIDTMRDANGAGLAANQVFEGVRVCVIEVRAPNPRYPYKPGIELTVLVNPVVTPLTADTFDNYEGCLSVPNLRGLVPRYTRVQVTYLDRDGAAHDVEVAGVTAGTYQHEVDHLDGRLFVDRVEDTATLTTWDAFKRHHEAAFIERIQQVVDEFGS
jgi:peptide deformylase